MNNVESKIFNDIICSNNLWSLKIIFVESNEDDIFCGVVNDDWTDDVKSTWYLMSRSI